VYKNSLFFVSSLTPVIHLFDNNHPKMYEVARCWWLTPVILATWEPEIRRIEVGGQFRQII
jgi:hypothetical protein